MVPLPHWLQCLAAEVIASVVRSTFFILHSTFFIPHVWLKPCAWSTADVAWESEIGIAVFPCHGHEAAGASHGIEVEHRHCPPFTVGSIHYAALMYCGAAHRVAAIHGDIELKARLRDRRSDPHVAHRLRHLGAESFHHVYGARLVRSPDIVCHGTLLAAHRGVVGGDDVVFAVYLVGMVSLAHGRSVGDNLSVAALHEAAEVGFYLRAAHCPVLVYGIDLAVVVEQH